MSLALFQTDNRDLSLLQTSWKAAIDPLLSNPLLNGIFLKGIILAASSNTINHLLGRKPQGYLITDINAAATIYRSQPYNNLTLILTSSAVATVSIYVF